MKANVPEKIYIHIKYKPCEITFSEVIEKECSNIEYVRKDAFIEKACEFLDGCIPDYIELKHANVDTFMNVDNKRFIEDFKNYIKGR